ncbi:MAG: hypothetical protein KDA78_11515, partial [Planctomycetaceae bacterium]|nr:hypothetical protein [Planctomycetaceae bacterium]
VDFSKLNKIRGDLFFAHRFESKEVKRPQEAAQRSKFAPQRPVREDRHAVAKSCREPTNRFNRHSFSLENDVFYAVSGGRHAEKSIVRIA